MPQPQVKAGLIPKNMNKKKQEEAQKTGEIYKQVLSETIRRATDVSFRNSMGVLGKTFDNSEVTQVEINQIMLTLVNASARTIANAILSELASIGLFEYKEEDIVKYISPEGEVDFSKLEEPKKKLEIV